MPRFETPVELPSDPSEDLEAATKQYVDSQAGGASELSDLTDVDTDGVANNDFLRYSESAGEWLPVAVSPGSGAEALDDLNDVDVPSVVEGDMLYQNDSGLWVVVAGTKDEGSVPTIQAGGSVAWETPSGGDGGDPLGVGVPMTPAMLQWGTFQNVGADQGRWFRVIGSGTINAIGLHIGTSSGNMSVAVYRKTGVGRDARPGVRLATTGSIASPGTGYREIALGSSVAVENGDFFFVSTSNSSLTFRVNATAAAAAQSLGLGFAMFATNAHPAPDDNPTITDGLNGWMVAMVGILAS